MTIKTLCTILDVKTELWSTPFFVTNIKESERMFANLCNDKNSIVHQNPEDFLLYYCGTFDDEKCKFEIHDPHFIATAMQLYAGDYHEVSHDAPVQPNPVSPNSPQ